MNEFNKNTNESEQKNENNSSGFTGFDSSEQPQKGDGYTVTPNSGYYEEPTAQHTESNSENADTQVEAQQSDESSQKPKSGSFFPSGNYGEQSASASAGANNSGNYGEYQTPPYYSSTQYGTGQYGNGQYGTPYTSPFVTPQKPPKKPKEPRQKKQHSFGIGSLIAVALIAAILTSGCFWVLTNATVDNGSSTQQTSSESTQKTTEKVVSINGSIEELAETAANKAGSSVVGVQTTYAVQSFFSGQSTSTGSGSGVIYKSDGYIITNYHVIEKALTVKNSTISVFLNNDTTKSYKASVINYNISCDLAVLKIDKTGLDAIEIADSDKLKVGQYVVAIGSPGGLEFMGSTTFGIISGINRQISTTSGTMKLIQTDAAINPGNSGGALVNTEGKLIGISSSKLVDESYEGMGFAIPVNTVVKICDNLIAHEGEGEAYTGISISSNYTSDVLKYYGYPVGAVVAGVDNGSPAAEAGIQRGDIITKFGDTEISEYTQYESALSEYYPKDKVSVTYYRSGKTQTVTLTIGSSN